MLSPTSQSGVVPADTSPLAPRMTLPELLSPAGDWDCVKAAVENGADAIYFGLDRFNARMRAANFTEADLPTLMAFLHRRGVRGYISFNTLVFADELADAEGFLRACIAAGVDAAIVQDVGICRLIRTLSPDFPIHASTQMTVTSAAGVGFARELGCHLVVLARECTLQDIERIQAAQGATEGVHDASSVPKDQHPGMPPGTGDRAAPSSKPTPLPLEVFVHGALCVAYSGQCLTSESLGGRSANRGECAQACRLPYGLIADGQPVPLGDRRYLLSPQDLAGMEVLPDLVRLGVRSLKIEGRLKSPEYVANITRLYRQALDRLAAPSTARGPDGGVAATPAAPNIPQYEMEMAFSRGLHTGWFRGINNQALVHARFGKKRGVLLGEVRRVEKHRVVLRLEGPLKPGDGVVFDAGAPDQPEEGGRVYSVEPRATEVALSFGQGDIDFRRVQVGNKVWKTSDPELDRRLRQSYSGDQPRHQRPIDFEVHGNAGEPLVLIVRDGDGRVARAASTVPLLTAENQPLGEARLREQLGRLGGTPFRLGTLSNHLAGAVMLPVSELNRLRRDAVGQLETLRAQPLRWTLNLAPEAPLLRPLAPHPAPAPERSTSSPSAASAELIVLVRSLPQLEAALAAGVSTLYCELEDPKKYRDAVARFRAWQQGKREPQRGSVSAACGSAIRNLKSEIFVAPPRIAKPGEEWILKLVRSCDADGYLVRNFDQLAFFADARRVGDFSLNVANPLAAEYFKHRFGLERLTASYDLNNRQLEALLTTAPPDWFEITIHQHMPMFHMEHCVFCAFLSTGTDYTNCGRPCDRQDLRLRDRVGAEHPVKADAGCRNTVYNAAAQTGAEYVARLLELGVRQFRIEFLDETPEVVTRTIGMYRRLLAGEITGAQLWRELRLRHQLGVTRGSLDKVDRPLTVL